MRIDPLGAGKLAADGIAVTTLLGSLVNMLPAFAALLTLIWTAIRIYETKTVQALLGRRPQEGSADD